MKSHTYSQSSMTFFILHFTAASYSNKFQKQMMKILAESKTDIIITNK